MAKFCIKCGNTLNGGEKFCNKCGTAVENQVDASNASAKTVETTSDTSEVDIQEPQKQSRKYTLGVVVAFAVVIAIIIAIANSGKPYEKPLENFATAINNNDYHMFLESVNPYYYEWEYRIEERFQEYVNDLSYGKFEAEILECREYEKDKGAVLLVKMGYKNLEEKLEDEIVVTKKGDKWYVEQYDFDVK